MTNAFVIAFRDRGIDPLRGENLKYVTAYVEQLGLGPVYVIGDGRAGNASFNRHAAYNAGSARAFGEGATTVTYYESDMIVPREQLLRGIELAIEQPRLVIPFDERHELTAESSAQVRAGTITPQQGQAEVIKYKPRRVGAINILTKEALEAVGRWDTMFEGSHWDDRSMHTAFEVCCGRGSTAWVPGPSWHLYHLPGYQGAHLTGMDRNATARNKRRWQLYQQATTPERIRELTAGGG